MRLVKGNQFTEEDANGPAVGDDMMHGQHQQIVFFAEPNQGAAKKQIARKVELARGQTLNQGVGGGRPVRRRALCDIVDGEFGSRVFPNNRNRRAIYFGKIRSKNLVPAQDRTESGLPRGGIDASENAAIRGDVVG